MPFIVIIDFFVLLYKKYFTHEEKKEMKCTAKFVGLLLLLSIHGNFISIEHTLEQDLDYQGINTITQEENTMELNIGIRKQNADKVASLLNQLLSDEFILYIKTLNYHWNLRGMQFHDLHAFFKELYEKQLDFSDDVAERARTIGADAFGSAAEFLKNSQLKETAGNAHLNAEEMVRNLLNDHETIIRSIRKYADQAQDLEDAGTNNFLVDLMEKHEKIAWMLRASLE